MSKHKGHNQRPQPQRKRAYRMGYSESLRRISSMGSFKSTLTTSPLVPSVSSVTSGRYWRRQGGHLVKRRGDKIDASPLAMTSPPHDLLSAPSREQLLRATGALHKPGRDWPRAARERRPRG